MGLMGRKKLLFRLMPIKNIGPQLLLAFGRATNSRKLSMRKVESASVKIGVFHNGKTVGFLSAGVDQKKVLVVHGFYVQQKYRGNEIGTRLIRRIILEASRRNLAGIDFERMTMQTNYLFGRQKKIAWAKKGNSLEFSIMSTRGGNFLGRIRFMGGKK